MTLEQIKQLYKTYRIPENIFDHCLKVTEIALFVGSHLKEKFPTINLSLVQAGGLLHDLLKICDVKNFSPEEALKRPHTTQEDIDVWLEIRKKYGHLTHYEAGEQLLNQMGHPIIARIIRSHDGYTINDPIHCPKTWEEKLVFYADKRVTHDTINPLKERMIEAAGRYAGGIEKISQHTMETIEKCISLETEIFSHLSITPEDITNESLQTLDLNQKLIQNLTSFRT